MTSQVRPNPYVGPRPFQTGEILYGRDQEIMDLLDLLIAERIVLFYSPSGAGKTSLIQAGLLPELEQEDFQVLPVMRVSLEPPPDQSVENIPKCNRYVLSLLLSLEEGLPADRQLSVTELAGMTLAQYLEQWQQGVSNLDLTAKSPISADGSASPTAKSRFSTPEDIDRVVLIFDQFEEILTVAPTNRPAKTEFFEQVGNALRHPDRWALFSMREEFPTGLDPYLRHIPTRLSTTFRLELLGREAACQAMQEPANQAGIPFNNIAADKLIDDLRRVRVQQPDGSTTEQLGLYIEPVQLQVVCHRLWENLPENAIEIQESDVQQAGDVDSALATYYADRVKVTAQQSGVRERVIREWFDNQLITEQGIRGQVLRGQEQSQGLENTAIEPLVDAHLVRAENRRGATWYELAHDRLIEPVRKNNAEWFQTHLSTLQHQAVLWESQNRSKGLLLRDDALEEAEHWAVNHQEELTSTENNFFAACQEARAQFQKEHRKNRFIQGLAIVATIIMCIAVYFFFQAEGQRKEAEHKSRISLTQVLAFQGIFQQKQGKKDERAALLARQVYLFNQKYQAGVEHQVNEALRTVLNTPHFSHILQDHERAVHSVAFSPDGKTLASGSGDKTLRLWDLTNPISEPTILRGHEDEVSSVAFSPDGETLASGSQDATVRVWDLTNSSVAHAILQGHEETVYSVAFSPDGQTLASGSRDATVRLWDLTNLNAAPVVLRGHEKPVFPVVFSPDGQTLASGSLDKTVRLWNLHNLDATPTILRGNEGAVFAIAFSPDSKLLASGGRDKTVRLWNLTKSAPRFHILGEHGYWVLSLAFSPDGQRLASGSEDLTVGLWDLQHSNPRIATFEGHDSVVSSVAFSPDGRMLASGSGDHTVRLWELTDPIAAPTILHDVGLMAFSPESQRLAVFDNNADTIMLLWDLTNLDAPSTELRTHKNISSLYSGGLSPDGQTLALRGQDNTVWLWDLQYPSDEPTVLRGHEAFVNSVAFSPDGQILASGSADATVRLWDLQSPSSEPTVLRGHTDQIFSVAFSPDGQTLASSSKDATVRLWDLTDLDAHPTILQGHSHWVTAVAFSPDSQTLASGSWDRTVRLWDLTMSDATPVTLHGHENMVMSVAFSPDGQTLASSSMDKTVRLWDLTNPDTAPTLLGVHEDRVWSAAFSSDGQMLISDDDENIHLWTWRTETLADMVCEKVWRNLTIEEWRQFVGEGIPYERTCPDLPEGK